MFCGTYPPTSRLAFVGTICGLVAATALLFANPALAHQYVVNRAGDFNLSDVDLTTTSVLGMSIERTYNSLDNDLQGIFGKGWSAIYETYLAVQDDGSIVVYEWRGGAKNRFRPSTSDVRPQNQILDEIMQAAEKTGQFGSDADRKAYQAWLVQPGSGNEEYEWERFVRLGLVKSQDPPVGSTFFSGRFGAEFITRVPEGYERKTRFNGRVVFEAFDESGRLTRIWNANHDYVALRYNSDSGNLEQMTDNSGDRFLFTFSTNGLVKTIRDSRGFVLIYLYNKNADLQSLTINGHVTRYKYDKNDRLVEIDYPDKTTMHVKYDRDANASYVKNTDGTVATYAYQVNKSQTSELDTITKNVRDPSGNTRTTIDQYFYNKVGLAQYLSKIVETTNGVADSHTYDRDGDILTHTTPIGTTSYTYDEFDRTTSMKTPFDQLFTWAYDPASGKLATFTANEQGSVSTENFEYDQKGNLIHAYDSDGTDFRFNYDPFGRMSAITGRAMQLSFAYESVGYSDPSTITLAGVGSVTITYNPNGGFTADSSSGGTVVNQVRAALQAVNDLIGDDFTKVITLPAPGNERQLKFVASPGEQ